MGIFNNGSPGRVHNAPKICISEQTVNQSGDFRGRKVQITAGTGILQQGAAGRGTSARRRLSSGPGRGAPESYVISMGGQEELVRPGRRRVVPTREKLASIKQKCESTSWFQSPLKRFVLQLRFIVLYLKNRS